MPFHRSVFTNFAVLIKTFVIMKRFISIILFTACTILCSAQTSIKVVTPGELQPGLPCDTLRYVITYDMAYVEDTLQVPMKAAHETMLLEIGRKVTAFYSYDAYRSDSINAGLLSRGATQYSVLGRIPWRCIPIIPKRGARRSPKNSVLTASYALKVWKNRSGSFAPTALLLFWDTAAGLPQPAIRAAFGAHGTPRTYLYTLGRGNSADFLDSYCALTTAVAIMCLMR